jgi:hypothetical protein
MNMQQLLSDETLLTSPPVAPGLSGHRHSLNPGSLSLLLKPVCPHSSASVTVICSQSNFLPSMNMQQLLSIGMLLTSPPVAPGLSGHLHSMKPGSLPRTQPPEVKCSQRTPSTTHSCSSMPGAAAAAAATEPRRCTRQGVLCCAVLYSMQHSVGAVLCCVVQHAAFSGYRCCAALYSMMQQSWATGHPDVCSTSQQPR